MSTERITAQSAGLTHPGIKRSRNDDSFLVDPELGLYVVCDGVSGHVAGDEASAICVKAIRDHVSARQEILVRYRSERSLTNRAQVAGVLRDAIHLAADRIAQAVQADPAKTSMSTTAEVLLLVPDYAIIAHVGDSRTYLVRGGQSHLLTDDHKVSNEMRKQGLWNESDTAHSPYANVLTRAVGLGEFVQVDTLQVETMPGDLFLLCSDGLSDYFRAPADFGELARGAAVADLPGRLIQFANQAGGKDNITAVTVGLPLDTQSSAALNALRKGEILGKVPLFSYLGYPELLKVLSLARLGSFAPGALMLEEGKLGEDMFVLVSGAAEVLKAGQVISRIERGSVLGEMALFDKAPRSASVRAAEPTQALMIARRDLLALLRQEPPIAVKFLWALNIESNRRLRTTSQDLATAMASLENESRRQADLPFVM